TVLYGVNGIEHAGMVAIKNPTNLRRAHIEVTIGEEHRCVTRPRNFPAPLWPAYILHRDASYARNIECCFNDFGSRVTEQPVALAASVPFRQTAMLRGVHV